MNGLFKDQSFNLSRESGRREIKFVTNKHNIHLLNSWINSSSPSLYPAFPDRVISNIYFDTDDYFSYRENLSGASYREKLRLRWYGATFTNIIMPNLELKVKKNRIGWKFKQVLEGPNDISKPWLSIFEKQNLNSLQEPASRLTTPTLMNQYSRKYFESKSSPLRVTIDTDLKFFEALPDKSFNNFSPTLGPDIIIIEVKFPLDISESVIDLINTMPLSSNRGSKYAIGIQTVLNL